MDWGSFMSLVVNSILRRAKRNIILVTASGSTKILFTSKLPIVMCSLKHPIVAYRSLSNLHQRRIPHQSTIVHAVLDLAQWDSLYTRYRCSACLMCSRLWLLDSESPVRSMWIIAILWSAVVFVSCSYLCGFFYVPFWWSTMYSLR